MLTTPVMSDEEYYLFSSYIHQKCGIHYDLDKRELLERKITPRLEELGLESFYTYYFYLLSSSNLEEDHFISSITNNESYFFRETSQMEIFIGEGIEELQRLHGRQKVRVLSAGCSTGEEVYSLNYYLAESPLLLNLEHAVCGMDIDNKAVSKATAATYGAYSLRMTSESAKLKFLSDAGGGMVKVRDLYRKNTFFKVGNLLDLSTYPPMAPFHAIFCRNVFIYFSDSSLLKVLENFANVLVPSGLLFLGHSESIIGRSRLFEPVRLGDMIVYRKAQP